MDGTAYTIVGIIPSSFSFGGSDFFNGDAYTPIGQSPDWVLRDRKMTYLHGVGRLKPGVTLDQARADMSTVARRKTSPATPRLRFTSCWEPSVSSC